MKKAFCFTAIALFLFLLTSCFIHSVPNSVYRSGRGDLFVPISYSMPVDSGHYSNQTRSQLALKELEIDNYGRTLCSLSFRDYKNEFFQNGEVYCIVQQSSDSETSFYEDVCCAGVTDPEKADAVIEDLKQKNDWNLPLDPVKMTTIPYKDLDPAGVYAIPDKDDAYYDAALQYLRLNSYGCYFEFVCRDAYGRTLITLSYPKTRKVYLVMMRDGKVLDSAAPAHQVKKLTSPWEEIREFKQENQWNMPFG